MEVSEKRKLLEAIEILVKRPAMANEVTLGNAIGYFTKLVEDATGGQLSIVVVEEKAGFEEWFNDYENKHEAYADVIAKDAWDYKQAEIDALQKKYDAIHRAFYLVEKHRYELGKRIDLIVDLVHDQTIDYFLDNLIQDILKGGKND